MSSYVPTDWVDDVTPVDAARMDNIEAGLVAAHDGLAALDTRLDAEEAQPDIPPVEDGKWLTGAGGALVWADAPVGGGGAIEYENAWAAGTAYQPGDVVIHEGVEYLAVNPSTGDEPAPAAAPSPAVIPLVTILPATPFDGQEVVLTDSLTTPTYRWRLRYNAGSTSAYKWEFVGGSPLYHGISTLESGTTAAAWFNLPTVGPQVTIPRPGEYEFSMSATLQKVGGADLNVQAGVGIGDFGAGTELVGSVGSAYASTAWIPASALGIVTVAAAGTLYRMRYYQSAAGTLFGWKRWLFARPVRLS